MTDTQSTSDTGGAAVSQRKPHVAPTLGPRGEHLSIMVPTYNCAEYLADTLNSLKAQGSKLEQAQIEVIDDCSTKDEPEQVVRELWPERVSFYRHPQNVGPIANFNACLERAERPWIHILHGDDYMLTGAYEEIERCLVEVPEAKAVFGRSVTGDADGIWTGMSVPLGPSARGRLEYRASDWGQCPVQFAGVLFSREAVQTVGNFDDSFCHVADWNMWWRLAKTVPVAYTNECVSFYRQFEGNHSSTLRRHGINSRESFDQVCRVAADLQANGESHTAPPSRLFIKQFHRCKAQCEAYLDDPEAFRANLQVLAAYPASVGRRKALLRLRLRHWRARLRGARRNGQGHGT